MLSPRTLSLRMKNRSLLTALDKYTEKIIQNNSTEEVKIGLGPENTCFKQSSIDLDNDVLLMRSKQITSFDEYLSKQDLNSRNTHPLYDSCSFQRSPYDCIGLEGYRNVPVDNSLNTAFESKRLPLHQAERNTKESLPEHSPPVNSTSDSQTIDNTVVKPLKSSSLHLFKKKNNLSRNCITVNEKAGGCKTISLEQQRAAQAQMHAPTHSHSLSKCYCIGFEKNRTQPDSKYIVQVYGRKQHIPSRLKRQRYRADSISRHSRTVRWADRNDQIRSLHSEAEDQASEIESRGQSEIFRNLPEPFEISLSSNKSSHSHHESGTTLLDRVKTFREAHWSDCHAAPQGETASSNHECVQHYVLNKRSFLEPLHAGDDGDGSCPVCSLSSNNSDKQTKHDVLSSIAHENRLSHVIVTLPTLILEPDNRTSIAETSTRRKEETINSVKQKISCCFIDRHSHLTKSSFIRPPSDSLALRYQKKA